MIHFKDKFTGDEIFITVHYRI